jgi:hypothetical protein
VSTTGWIFLVGTRVFDLGAMIVWLVWFFRQQDEPDDEWWDEGGGGGGGDPPSSPRDDPRGPGLDLPLPDASQSPDRLRDHTSVPRRRIERRADPARLEPLREREPERRQR